MFKDNLKELRKSNGYSMDELCKLYNKRFNGKMNKSTLSRYENGLQEPMFTVVKNLSELFGVSVDELTDNTISAICSQFDNISPIRTQRIPLLGEIACGEPIYCDEDRESYVEVGADIRADFCLRAKGDSMINARICDGDIVFIRQQPMVENGEIAAVIIDDEATLKRVYYYKDDGKLVLQAENPKYSPLVYVGEELNTIRILGKAIAFESNL